MCAQHTPLHASLQLFSLGSDSLRLNFNFLYANLMLFNLAAGNNCSLLVWSFPMLWGRTASGMLRAWLLGDYGCVQSYCMQQLMWGFTGWSLLTHICAHLHAHAHLIFASLMACISSFKALRGLCSTPLFSGKWIYTMSERETFTLISASLVELLQCWQVFPSSTRQITVFVHAVPPML